VEFPSDEAGHRVTRFHTGSGEDPVIGPSADPVAAAIKRVRAARAHKQRFVRTRDRERVFVKVLHLGFRGPAEPPSAAYDAIRPAVMCGLERRDAAHRIAAQVELRNARFHGRHRTVVLP